MKKLLVLSLTLLSFAVASSAPTATAGDMARQDPCLGCY